MAKLSKSALQAALNSLAAANRRAQVARDKIMAHCEAVYGVSPGDVDNDEFIDGVDGGCGASDGMTADAFHRSMLDAMEHAGIALSSKVEPDFSSDAFNKQAERDILRNGLIGPRASN